MIRPEEERLLSDIRNTFYGDVMNPKYRYYRYETERE